MGPASGFCVASTDVPGFAVVVVSPGECQPDRGGRDQSGQHQCRQSGQDSDHDLSPDLGTDERVGRAGDFRPSDRVDRALARSM